MKRFAFLLVVLSIVLSGVAHAQSSGVPFIAGSWSGKISAKIYDQTIPGSNDKRIKYKSKVDVVISQTNDDLIFTITFATPLPVASGENATVQTFPGNVGNYHMNIQGTVGALTVVGSGSIDKKAKKIRMTGTGASAEFTNEFKLKLKRQN